MELLDDVRTFVSEHPDSFFMGGCALFCVGFGSYCAGLDGGPPKDVLTETRVKMYPYIAAASLTILDIMLEKLGTEKVNFLLMFYFGLAGANSIWFLLRSLMKPRGPRLFNYPKSRTILTEFIFPSKPLPFYLSDIPLYAFAIGLNALYFNIEFNHTLNNVIAGSIAMYAIMCIRIEKFTAAAPMLWGLLLYDVFFVYRTDVMTTVAVHLRGPVKLVYAKNEYGSSVLGLGDIVIPGFFLSVCSRFDAFLYKVLGKKTPYWFVGMLGYMTSLVVTDVVCFITREGQPALLFITPSVTLPVVLLALYRKEHYAFLSFSG